MHKKEFLKFIIPILLLFLAFRVSSLIGFALLAVFFLYACFVERAGIFAQIGNMFYVKGKEEQAMKWIKRAVSYKNCGKKVFNGYAILLLRNGRYEEAEKVLDSVINSNANKQDKTTAQIYLSVIEWKKGRLYSAANKLEGIYKEVKNTNLYGVLGYFMILKGKYEEALSFNKEAYEFNNSNSIILNNLANNHYLLGEVEEAEKLFEKLLELNPNFREAYYNYGKLLLDKGDKEKAKEMMKKALETSDGLLCNIKKEDIDNILSSL